MSDTPQRRGAPAVVTRTLRALSRVELAVGIMSMVAILVLVFYQALQRYLPLGQIAWTGEISRFSMVWLTFALMGWLVTERSHIALEIVDTLRSPRLVRAVQVFALVIVSATGVGIAFEAFALVTTQGIIKSPVLRIPMSWVYVPVLFGAVATALRAVIAAVDIAVNGPFAPAEAVNDNAAEGTA